MNKVKILTIAVVVLILLNAASMAVMYKDRHGHRGPKSQLGPKALVIERLHLDEEQVKQYEVLIHAHQEMIGKKDDEMMAARKLIYKDLTRPGSPVPDSLTLVVGNIQRSIEQTHYQHFAAIRAICRPEQFEDYDVLVSDLAELFNGRKIKGSPKR